MRTVTHHSVRVPEAVLAPNKQTILNSFKQGHLITHLSSLNEEQRDYLMRQLEILQFDMLDLVDWTLSQMYHKHLQDLTKLKGIMDRCGRPDPHFYLDSPQSNPTTTEIAASTELQHTYELGLKAISEGKVGLIICAGLWKKFKLGVSKLIDEPSWEIDATLLQVVIEKLRALGNFGIPGVLPQPARSMARKRLSLANLSYCTSWYRSWSFRLWRPTYKEIDTSTTQELYC